MSNRFLAARAGGGLPTGIVVMPTLAVAAVPEPVSLRRFGPAIVGLIRAARLARRRKRA